MPLFRGKKNIGRTISTEIKAGKPRRQAIAIALHTAGVSRPKPKASKRPRRKR